MENLKEFKKWVDVILKLGPWLIGVEIILGIIVAISARKSDAFTSVWFMILVAVAAILIFINVLKYKLQKSFPKRLIENIEDEFNADNTAKNLARKSLINDAIVETLKGLNTQTCNFTVREYELIIDDQQTIQRMCERDIEEGVFNLLEFFINNLPAIFNSFYTKFTVAFHYHGINIEGENNTLEDISQVHIIKDDLNLRSDLARDLLYDNDLTGHSLEIKNHLTTSLNNSKFIFDKFYKNDEEYSIISSIIPIVCNDDHTQGIFIVIGKGLKEIPEDSEEVFKIFNRILTNWISKYNDCVRNRIALRND